MSDSGRERDQRRGLLRGGLLERFHILGKLGVGASSKVYRAHQISLDREVVLKILDVPPERLEVARPRFERECAILAGLRHTNVVELLDHGVDGEQAYLVYPATQGRSLDVWMKEVGLPSALEVACWARDILRGLEVAHGVGVIHRDLKPGNLLLLPDGTVQLLDFGLASQIGRERLTRTGVWVGTPAYASPEQILGSGMGPRSDLYSLGVVLYQLLTGLQPFVGTLTEVVERHLEYRPKAAAELDPTIPVPLSDLVMQLLEKDPDDRPDNAAEARRWVERILTELRSGAHPRPEDRGTPRPRTKALKAPRTRGRGALAGSVRAPGSTRAFGLGRWRPLATRLAVTLGLATVVGLVMVRPSAPPGPPIPLASPARLGRGEASRWARLLDRLRSEAAATYTREQLDPLHWETTLAGLAGVEELRGLGEAAGGLDELPPSLARELSQVGRHFARAGLPDPVAPYLPLSDLPVECPLDRVEVEILAEYGVDATRYRPTGAAREVVFACRRVRSDLDRLRHQLWFEGPATDPAVLRFRQQEMVVASQFIGEPDLDRLDFALQYGTGRVHLAEIFAGAITPRTWRAISRTRALLARRDPGAPVAWALATDLVEEYHAAFFGGAGYLAIDRLLGGALDIPEHRYLWAILTRKLRHTQRGAGKPWFEYVEESNAVLREIAPWMRGRPGAIRSYLSQVVPGE